MSTTNTSLTVFTDAKPLDLSRIHNAALLKEAEALQQVQTMGMTAINNTVSNLDELRRTQAEILSRIQTTKLYEKDGFKSLAEFAETIGLNKSNAHQLAAAGNVYNDKAAPKALKELSPSKLATLSAAIKADKVKVYTDAEQGKFKGATQQELKTYANEQANAKSPAKVVKTYQATEYLTGRGIIPDPEHKTRDYTMTEWESFYQSNGAECIKIPKGKASPDSDKATIIRYLIIDPDKSYQVIEFREYNPKANGPVKNIDPRENAISRLISNGASLDEVNNTMRLMAWDEITSEDYDNYID